MSAVVLSWATSALLRVTFSRNENGPGACTGGMVGALPGMMVLEPDVDPAALACPRVPTGESKGGTAGVEAGAVAAVTVAVPVAVAVAVLLTVVGAVVEGDEVGAGKVVTGGPTPGPAVVPDAGVADAPAAEVLAKTVGIFALPVLLVSVEPVEALLVSRAAA